MHRSPLRKTALLASALLMGAALLPNASAYAAGPIGGPKLGSKGVVFDIKPGSPAPPAVPAEGWLVADLDTGGVIGARNPHGRFLPASTLKTLTAIALLPKLSPRTIVKPSKVAADMEGSRVGIKAGFPISVELLFTGMLINSGNDTATALAEAAGGQATTVKMMNEHAKRLQAADTLAANPTGLDAADQFSSAYDLALIGREALKNKDFARYTLIKKALIPTPTTSFEIANKNRLLYTYEGSLGGKTGGTKKALNTYIGFAQRGGRRLVVTLMKAPVGSWQRDAPKLLDWGFAVAGTATPVGLLVPPLDAQASSPTASPAVQGSTADPSSTAPALLDAPSIAPTATAAAARRATAPGPAQGSLADRLPTLRWWYAAVAVALAGLGASGLAWRGRRRRRRGFYSRSTKLRLPVR